MSAEPVEGEHDRTLVHLRGAGAMLAALSLSCTAGESAAGANDIPASLAVTSERLLTNVSGQGSTAGGQFEKCEKVLSEPSVRELLILSSRSKWKNCVLLGGDRRPISRCRMEMPVGQSGETLRVNIWSEALQDSFVDDLSAFVNCDLDNFIAGNRGKLPGVDHRVGSHDGKRGTDLIAIKLPLTECPIGKSCLRAVTKGGECLRHRFILLSGASKRGLWRGKFGEFFGSAPRQLLSEALALVALGSEIGRAARALVWILAGPIETRNRCAIFSKRDRPGGQQYRLGGVEHPRKNYGMQTDRGDSQPALATCSGGIQLRKHRNVPGGGRVCC